MGNITTDKARGSEQHRRTPSESDSEDLMATSEDPHTGRYLTLSRPDSSLVW